MQDQHKLGFPLLSDAGNNVARRFGLIYRVNDEQQALYRRAYVNLPFANGDETWELPIPATYILDRDRTVLYASANEDYTERPEPEAIVDVLEHQSRRTYLTFRYTEYSMHYIYGINAVSEALKASGRAFA